jgi:choline monooxygenase
MDLSDYKPENDLALATTLPARWYIHPAFLELEKEKIFWRTWQPVGFTGQVSRPGDFFACDLLGEPLVITRDANGSLHTLSNVCRHRGSTIAANRGNCATLRCPYHGWTYSLDGRLLGQPEFEGVRDWDRSTAALPSYRSETWDPFVFVNLDADAPPLAEILGDIPQNASRLGCDLSKLHYYGRRDYVIDCNWKVYIDNYLEGYHVPAAHPGLFRELDYKQYRVDTYPYYSSHYAPLRPADTTDRRHTSPDSGAGALYYWIFPNFMLNIYPDKMSSNVIIPLSHNRTLAIFEWFFYPDAGAQVRAKTIAFSDEIQQEDIRLCEAVQRGLGSRTYDRGRLSVKRENGVHHFHLLLHRFLTQRSAPESRA